MFSTLINNKFFYIENNIEIDHELNHDIGYTSFTIVFNSIYKTNK